MRWLLAVLVCGCNFHPGASTAGDDVGAPDAPPPIDAPVDVRIGYCLGNATIEICLSEAPAMPLLISATANLDTDLSSLCATNVVGGSLGQYCVLAASAITVAGGKLLSAKGTRPLVLFSSGTIKVSGTIDVAGHLDGTPQGVGAGGDPSACGDAIASTAGGGGYGGSFGASGAPGGGNAVGGVGGVPGLPAANPLTLRGGCSGGAGLEGGGPGFGGGAVALIAATSIQIDGTINASGGGAPGSHVDGRGGGGGGSGGVIVIDAPMVFGGGGARMVANGGSGGEGSGSSNGKDGADAPADPTMAAQGGSGGSSGGDGGDGSKGNGIGGNAPGPGLPGVAEGGGGGGGGAGVIKRYKAASLPGVTSPPPT